MKTLTLNQSEYAYLVGLLDRTVNAKREDALEHFGRLGVNMLTQVLIRIQENDQFKEN